MNRAFWRYYKDIALIDIPLSLVILFYSNLTLSLLFFCSFGVAFGLLFFKNFKSNEYYLYHNLGFTKKSLLQKVIIVNLAIAVPILLLLQK